jgi:predicted TIM-barrel fold metal-dependent hydrolase
MRLIALEEHYRSPALRESEAELDSRRAINFPPDSPMGRRMAKLDELGEQRLADMDAAGIDLQVLSHSRPAPADFPPERGVDLARAANDHAAQVIAANPTRFGAFATLPLSAPLAAADELERAVSELGFCGAMIDGHTGGRFLDDPFFRPVLERAQSLDVPIYLHPAEPPEAVWTAYYDGLPGPAGAILARAGWGWHVETGMHVLRMILAGVLDELPRLQLIIGHMGEALPFMLAHSSDILAPVLHRSLEQYVASNLHFTTSAMFTYPPLLCLLLVAGADRVMFSVDYPFAENEEGRDFMLGAPISAADREKIAHGNAERLLGIEPAS